MTETQLYFVVGLPMIAILIGIPTSGVQFAVLNGRMPALERRFADMEKRFADLKARVETRFDPLMSKLFELDNRLSRLEERSKHS
jgi:hypothetical protein